MMWLDVIRLMMWCITQYSEIFTITLFILHFMYSEHRDFWKCLLVYMCICMCMWNHTTIIAIRCVLDTLTGMLREPLKKNVDKVNSYYLTTIIWVTWQSCHGKIWVEVQVTWTCLHWTKWTRAGWRKCAVMCIGLGDGKVSPQVHKNSWNVIRLL